MSRLVLRFQITNKTAPAKINKIPATPPMMTPAIWRGLRIDDVGGGVGEVVGFMVGVLVGVVVEVVEVVEVVVEVVVVAVGVAVVGATQGE